MQHPEWALLQVSLRERLEEAWREFAAKYTDSDGRLVPSGRPIGRDGADDFLEAIFNWPTLYALGGSPELLERCLRIWRGVGGQLEELGLFSDGFEIGYDWFHIGEGLELFYGLCLADPTNPELVEAVTRFAGLYLPDSPVGNYDERLNIIRAPHNGAGGPRPGIQDGLTRFGTERVEMRTYGLPVHGLPGIRMWDDLDAPGNAERMAEAMQRRFGSGDVAVNLSAVSLVTLAWLLTGERRWRDWVEHYVAGWMQRAEDNGGLLPDNVGSDGVVGGEPVGSWFGGLYGWTWPHGIHSLLPSALNAAAGLRTVGGGESGFALVRGILDAVAEQAIREVPAAREMTMKRRWSTHFGDEFEHELELWPTRLAPEGWFDYQPPQAAFPVWLWWHARGQEDYERLAALRNTGGWDWRRVRQFRSKEEAGHEDAWFAALADGSVEQFAGRLLQVAHRQVDERLAAMRADDITSGFDQDRWQHANPVVTEALVMTALGAPQALYNGGLQHSLVRYLDPLSGRPGLPPRVAALVESIDPERAIVQLVNLDAEAVELVLQAGGFGEHIIERARTTALASGIESELRPENASRLTVRIEAGEQIRVTMKLTLHGGVPRLA
ncbi:hypothetical protein [Gryllotalpicola koreensis]|uniref:Linalool dehydratase/isomerase domain-containing protein n=1 Tax=Gryllotalpicola koreensis TaxID=993086 RepID=A0ABP8A511_9MICO